MYEEIMDAAKEKMRKSFTVVQKELGSLRAGRANPQILDKIMVDYYGTPTPINQLGNISAPEPRMLVISLWESKLIPEVEKAIHKSDIGINPTNDGKLIRLIVPELNEERRKELVKRIRKDIEEGKVAVRAVRRESLEQFKKMEKSSDLTEDDLKDAETELQKITDEIIKDLDKLGADKEKEIMSV